MIAGEIRVNLSPEERMLLVLRDELYGGSWERMLEDLRYRRRRSSYIFKLVNRIQADIDRIEKLRECERKRRVNLGDFDRGGHTTHKGHGSSDGAHRGKRIVGEGIGVGAYRMQEAVQP